VNKEVYSGFKGKNTVHCAVLCTTHRNYHVPL